MKSNIAVIEADQVIVSMRRAHLALAEAQTIQQTKKIMDVAAAAEIYARRQKLGDEAMDVAASIKVEALRKLGEMLKVAPKNKGVEGKAGPGRGKPGAEMEPGFNEPATLAELGLTKKESAVAQKLADLSPEQFEQVRDGHVTVSKAIAAVEAAKPPEDAPAKKKAATKAEPAPEPVADPELDELRESVTVLADDNERLTDRLAVVAMEATEDERTAAAVLIAELRSENRILAIENDAIKASRDGLLVENAALKRQCESLLRKVRRAEQTA
jgi:hypothetical protein